MTICSKEQDYSKIIFVGGCHGVGKSTLLSALSRSDSDGASIKVISMSRTLDELARQRNLGSIVELNKNDLARKSLQAELISLLRKSSSEFVILDGHFLNIAQDGTIIDTNYTVNGEHVIHFDAIVVIVAEPAIIRERRIKNGQNLWSTNIDKIDAEQKGEITEAKRIGNASNTPVYIIENTNLPLAVKCFKEILYTFSDGYYE
jgi:adenylate kinase